MITIILFTLVVFMSNVIQGITGFAGTILAMPFCIMLVGIETSKQVLNVLGILASIWIIIISYKDILWKEYIKITSIMVIGLLIGMWAYDKVPNEFLLTILPLFIILISIRGLLKIIKENKKDNEIHGISYSQNTTIDLENNKGKNIIMNTLIFISGIIHGMFVTGGPLIVIYAAEKIKEKSNFRATLSLLWITLNSIVAFEGIKTGKFTYEVNIYLLISIIGLAIGMIVGNKLHYKMSEKLFMKITFVLLLISGISILI